MKKFTILLAFIFSILSFGNLYANSSLGHNTIALYCIWKLEKDKNFMPEIAGDDRYELTHPSILDCSQWKDLSNAQKAFLQGVNFPDCPSFMVISHNEAPMEILSAMYTLKDFCPSKYENKSKDVKAFICRMQRYMTWGSKLHVEMDKITHARLPYAEQNMLSHVFIEWTWDAKLSKEFFVNEMGLNVSQQIQLFNIANTDAPIFSLMSNDYTFDDESLDIRDKYVDFILGFYDNKKSSSTTKKLLNGIEALEGYKLYQINTPLPSNYQYPPLLRYEMKDLVQHIDLTKAPTQQDINEQYNIDLPNGWKEGPIRRGPTGPGKEMLKKVRALGET